MLALRIICSCVLLAVATTSAVNARETYYVSDVALGSVWRLEDLNGDGDALDAAEKLLWADGFTRVAELAADGDSLLAVEEGMSDGSNQIVRLTDRNGDGDALDSGERLVWADALDDPRSIARDDDGNWYVTETDDDIVWQMVDINGDGDVLDVGEQSVFAAGINGPATTMVHDGGILVAAFAGDSIHRLVDINNDGDALDVGENVIITPTFDQSLGLLDDGNGGFFFSSRSADTVYHAVDHNGDGDMLDLAEVLSYADAVFGDLDGPYDMAAHESGGFLLADLLDGEVVWVRDANGDDDALDRGDVTLFADGFELPIDIVAVKVLSVDTEPDGDVDGTDFLVIQRDDPTLIPEWQAQYGSESGSLAAGHTVPEPMTTGLVLLSIVLSQLVRTCPWIRNR